MLGIQVQETLGTHHADQNHGTNLLTDWTLNYQQCVYTLYPIPKVEPGIYFAMCKAAMVHANGLLRLLAA